ncbi:MAG: SRPBCC family protein, partial [Anaerolineae bacterium]
YPAGSAIGIWVLVLLVINTITLIFDAWDVIRWMQGDRAVHAENLDEPVVFREEIDIEASPAVVWQLLSDYKSYADWNPLVQAVTGETDKLGGRIKVKVAPLPFKLNATIDLLEEGQAVGWTDDFPMQMLTANPISRLVDNGDGTTTYLFEETFAGPALPLIEGNLKKQLPPIYKMLIQAVKARAEG